MAISAEELATNIAALTVPGLSIRKLNDIPEALSGRDCPIAYPVAEKFMHLESSRQVTFGERALWEYIYTLTYRYIHSPAGADRSVSKIMPGKANGVSAFIVAVARSARALGVNYVKPANIPEMGVLEDAVLGKFQAADILLRVTEFSAD